jgi:2-dehydro-3-deoxyglucarate aldolase
MKGDKTRGLKEALRGRELTLGSWLTFSAEAPAEIMARSGFQWLVIDMEHAPLTLSDAARLIRVIDLAGLPALCRLPANDPVVAKQVLDAGAMGILVPGVSSAADARRAVEAVYYPPLGKRGVGLARAQDYGSGLERYRQEVQGSLVVIAMVENQAGVEEAAAIAATPGLDGVFLGPYDLSASLGVIGQLDHPLVRSAQKKVLEAARAAGIACGIHLVHPSQPLVERAVEEGYTFMSLGVDMIILSRAAAQTAALGKASERGESIAP